MKLKLLLPTRDGSVPSRLSRQSVYQASASSNRVAEYSKFLMRSYDQPLRDVDPGCYPEATHFDTIDVKLNGSVKMEISVGK